MRITQKLYLFIVVALMMIMVPYGLIAYQRESAQFEADMGKDAELLARALSPIVETAWQEQGEMGVKALLERVNHRQRGITLRWVWLSGPKADNDNSPIDKTKLSALQRPGQILQYQTQVSGSLAMITYFTVQPTDAPLAAVELSEPFDTMNTYTRSTIVQLLLLTGFLIFAGALVMAAGGHFLVTRRINLLIQQARNIGQDDFSDATLITANDELGTLARELRQMSDKLQRRRTQLVEENQAKLAIKEQLRHAERLKMLGQLASGVAHELGTPLNVVIGRAKIMTQAAGDNEEITHNADIIQKQVLKMSKMVTQLLNFARRQQPQKSDFALADRIIHLVRLLKPIAEKNGVEIIVDKPQTELTVHADLQQIEQVLSNLIVNGVQAMEPGGRLSIAVSAQEGPCRTDSNTRRCAVITLTDTGPGIAGELQTQIFEPFFSTKKAGEGTGLGLSIANDIVTEHGGRISVSSPPDGGACFSVFLPME